MTVSATLAMRFADRLAGCRVVASVVPQHLYGLTFRIFLPMALGLPLHAAMLYYAEQLAALSHDHRYAFISSPAFLKRLDHRLTPPPVNMILSAGGMLPWGDVTQTAAWLNIWPDEIYGSTETGILAWRYRQQEEIAWLPFPGVHFQQEGEAFRAFSPLIVQQDGLYHLDRFHNMPAALIVQDPDPVLVAGAIIMEIPMVDRLPQEFYDTVKNGDIISVNADDGFVEIQ